jgi:ATP-binding cassette subfamily F protein 3
MTGETRPDEGTVSTGSLSVGYLKQDTEEQHLDRSVLDEAMAAFEEQARLMEKEQSVVQRLESAESHEGPEYEALLHELEHIHERQRHAEAHLMKPRAEAVLAGLGFDPEDVERPLSTFSGGWRMRAALARLLLAEPDVLLLDEPTNHLDIDSIDWLEAHLRSFRGSVVLVSHDRYFLDRMVNEIAELAGGTLSSYAGNYSFYLREREERRTVQRAAWENQQKMIAETERFIDRFRAKATKARQVQSRVKMLENLDRLPAPPPDQAGISFRFPEPPRANRVVLELSTFSKRYDTEEGSVDVFLKAGPLTIERGDRIALIGRNGAGKSTLSRILVGTEPFNGDRTLGSRVTPSFFAQNQAETLPSDRTVLEVLQESAYGQSETWIRGLLGAFLFQGDDVFKPVPVLSGGERSRVALARTLVSPANFLILDEPTNHLDILSREVLVEALRQYEGTYVVVSHDRHFLDRIAGKVWRAEDGSVREYHGNYSDYLWQIEHGTASRLAAGKETAATSGKAANGKVKSGGPKSREQKRREAELRSKQGRSGKENGAKTHAALNDFQLNRMYAETEARIETMEARRADLEAAVADPEVYGDVENARRVAGNLSELQEELEGLYRTWETLGKELERRTTDGQAGY